MMIYAHALVYRPIDNSTSTRKDTYIHNRHTRMHTQAASLPEESLNACYQNNIQYLSQQAAQQEVAGGGNQVQEMVPRQNG